MYQVYSCIILVLCGTAVLAKLDESLLTEDLKKLMTTLHQTCVKETGVDEANVDKLIGGEFVDDSKTKCYVKCVMSESGVMDDDGKLDFTALSEVIPEKLKETVKKSFDNCAKKSDGIDDHCEKAYAIVKCQHEEDPEVTGSNKGIGYAIVKGLLEKFDGDVYLTARDVKRGQEAVDQLKKIGLNPLFHQLDITDQNSINAFRDHIKTKHGGLDILINNAAIYFQADAPEPVIFQISEIIRVNYFANLRVCEALFPLLRKNARVVNLSSTSGHLSKIPSAELRAKFNDKNLTIKGLNKLMEQYVKDAEEGNVDLKAVWGQPYRVSKVGFSKLSMIQQKLFDDEIPNRNITVNSVHPGYVSTDLSQFKGPMTIDDGAKGPLFLALESKDIRGQYVWRDGSVVQWDAPDLPAPY